MGLDSLRKPLFLGAAFALALAFCLEIGSNFLTVPQPTDLELREQIRQTEPSLPEIFIPGRIADMKEARKSSPPPRPGFGIPYLALLDGLLLFTIVLITLSLVAPQRIQGRVQGPVTLILTILCVLGGIMMVMVTFALLMLMVGLFLAAPFGTAAYVAIWGSFPRGGAATMLTLIMVLKVVFAVLLVLSQPRFLQNKGLVIVIALSLLCNVIVAFLHGVVPRFLASITDALAAIIVAIVGIVWAVLMAIGALIATVKSIRLEKERA